MQFIYLLLYRCTPIPVPARSKPLVCGRSLTGFAGSNPAGGHGCLSLVSVVCCQVEVSATSWSLVQRNHTECDVPKSVCSWSLGNEETLAHNGLFCHVGYQSTHSYFLFQLILGLRRRVLGWVRQLHSHPVPVWIRWKREKFWPYSKSDFNSAV
jgi:hypothetical protein